MMKTDKVMLRTSDNQSEKLNKLVKYHNSDQAKILLRGLYLIDKFNLNLREFEDTGVKNKRVSIRLTEEESNLINKLENKFNVKYTDIMRCGIEIQYEILEDLKEYEKKLLTGK